MTTSFDERDEALEALCCQDATLLELSQQWTASFGRTGRQYLYDWFLLPIIQLPTDLIQLQEIIFRVQPDLIIETGIARGGSVAFNASMLALLEYQDALRNGTHLDPRNPSRKVCAIDIDIRSHSHSALESHPLYNHMILIQGSSVDGLTYQRVKDIASSSERILVLLDSNHTHQHVLSELQLYAPLVSKGSYCVVFDTNIEDMPSDLSSDRPWCKGNNPKTAVLEWIKDNPHFVIDHTIDSKLMISAAPSGYLFRAS